MDSLVPPSTPLKGGLVLLREFSSGDAAAISQACSDLSIQKFTFMEDLSPSEAEEWIEIGLERWSTGTARFAVTVPPADLCVGQVGIHFDFTAGRAEAFYWLSPEARGRGYGAEALELVTSWAFRDYEIERVQLVTHTDNQPSQALAERCGFTREGVLRAWEPVKGDRPDAVMWSRLASDAIVTRGKRDHMVRRFDAAALYEAMDAERGRRAMTWQQVSKEVGVSASTIRRTRLGGRMEVDGMLNLVAWLDVPVERFVIDTPC